MNAYQSAQEWDNLRWGTIMPVTVMIGSIFVEVRARGICSFAVADPVSLEEQVPDPDNLTTYVKSLLAQSIADLLGERSGEVSDIVQLTAITAQTIQTLQTKLDSKFSAIGLRLKSISIETIESL